MTKIMVMQFSCLRLSVTSFIELDVSILSKDFRAANYVSVQNSVMNGCHLVEYNLSCVVYWTFK